MKTLRPTTVLTGLMVAALVGIGAVLYQVSGGNTQRDTKIADALQRVEVLEIETIPLMWNPITATQRRVEQIVKWAEEQFAKGDRNFVTLFSWRKDVVDPKLAELETRIKRLENDKEARMASAKSPTFKKRYYVKRKFNPSRRIATRTAAPLPLVFWRQPEWCNMLPFQVFFDKTCQDPNYRS